jgi:hypothetical protein
MDAYPPPSFAHLIRLSDHIGLLEHARGALPLRANGYCVDDVARGLLVICREPAPPVELVVLAERYLAFLAHAEADHGMFHNRLSFDGRWLDAPDTGDWWGRAIWGLGTAAARAPVAYLRDAAFTAFERAIRSRSRWPRSMAFAGLGAAEVLAEIPDHRGARALLADAAITVGRPARTPDWPWPEPRLAYANAALAEVHLAAGAHLNDERALADGLRLLGWLVESETVNGHLSVTPVGGRAAGDLRPGFDQQAIEPAAIADACARARRVTGDLSWDVGLRRAIDWFLGENDGKIELADWETGGGCDGLERAGRNENQGAESTLALLSTLQHGRGLGRLRNGR